jgi:hypothetical protein
MVKNNGWRKTFEAHISWFISIFALLIIWGSKYGCFIVFIAMFDVNVMFL